MRPKAKGERKAGLKFPPNGVISTAEAVERLGELSATVDEVAIFFNCSQPVVSQRFRENPELRQAYDRGKTLSQISLRWLLFNKAKRPDGAGCAAALYLGRMLLWPADGDDGFIEKPPPEDGPASPESIAAQALNRLSPADREMLEALLAKLATPHDPSVRKQT